MTDRACTAECSKKTTFRFILIVTLVICYG
jgi:hypothetical protein